MPTLNSAETTSAHVTSRDGTRIGYLKVGRGPAVILLHGSMQTARSHITLATALADTFTVYLPDRRGRGMSGPHRPDHGIRTEVEDLAAVMAESGARMVFGVSVSALVILEAARTDPAIRKAALYEPALILQKDSEQTAWLERFDQEMAEGRVSAALITSMLGLELGPPLFNRIPRSVLAALNGMAMKSEEKKAAEGTVTMRQYAPTLHYEGVLLRQGEATLESYRDVRAEILLLGGSKGLEFLKPGREALSRTLPNSRDVELPGLDHGSTGDRSTTNREGSPEKVALVADQLRAFFSSAAR